MGMIKKTRNFYNRKNNIKKIILTNIGKNETIYGQSAINIQLPKILRVYTEDYDIFAKNPLKEAKQLERSLDKNFRGNYFKVQPAMHPGTFSVISLVDGKTYADYTLMPKNIPTKIIRGKKYVTLDYAKKNKIKILKDPSAKYRHAKDRDALNRIKLAQKSQRQGIFGGII